MSESNKSSNLTSIIVALIGSAGIIGSALITKGYFDKKIEEEYTLKENIKHDYAPKLEVEKLKEKISDLEEQLELNRSAVTQKNGSLKSINKENSSNIQIEDSLEPENDLTPIIIQKLGDWEFSLFSCKRINNDVLCSFSILSKHRNRNIMIRGKNPYKDGSLLFDNNGDKYEGGAVTLGNSKNPQSVSREIIADYPVGLSINFPDVAKNSKFITNLKIQIKADDISQKEIRFVEKIEIK